MNNLDHLVYAVPNLEKGIQSIKEKFGAEVFIGGQHKNHGTHNALLALSKTCYLEIIAPDFSNTSFQGSRWMGLDLIRSAKLSRWAITSSEINKEAMLLQKMHPEMGHISEGQRMKTDGSILSWKMLQPLAAPEVELLPFVIDWGTSLSPAASLPQECELIELFASHPYPEKLASKMEQLNASIRIEKGKEINLKARIKTPKGEIVI